MNALEHSRLMLTAAHGGLLGWTADVLGRAGVDGYDVLDDFPPVDAAPWLVVRAYQVLPWPKIVETSSPIPLAGPSGSGDDRSLSIPELWRQLGRAFAQCVDRLFPRPDGGSRTRIVATTALADLPEPVRDWYRSQAGDGASQWIVGDSQCRMPTLMWRPPLTVRVTFLLMAGGRMPAGAQAVPGVAALGVLSVAMNQERTMRLRVAPIPADPGLWTLSRAMAKGVGGDLGDALTSLVDQLTVDADYPVSLTPTSGPSGDDVFDLMRALGRPLLPALHVAIHLPLGARAEFGPGSAPSYAARGKEPPQGGR